MREKWQKFQLLDYLPPRGGCLGFLAFRFTGFFARSPLPPTTSLSIFGRNFRRLHSNEMKSKLQISQLAYDADSSCLLASECLVLN